MYRLEKSTFGSEIVTYVDEKTIRHMEVEYDYSKVERGRRIVKSIVITWSPMDVVVLKSKEYDQSTLTKFIENIGGILHG